MATADLSYVFLTASITDVSTASAVYIPISEGMAGEVINVRTVLAGAIGTADADITISNGTASMGVITIATASSATGDIDELIPTDADRFVVVGDYLKIATDGASTNTIVVGVTVTIKR